MLLTYGMIVILKLSAITPELQARMVFYDCENRWKLHTIHYSKDLNHEYAVSNERCDNYIHHLEIKRDDIQEILSPKNKKKGN